MITSTWTVMNELEESFNQITYLESLIDQLQEAVNSGETQDIVDITAALTAFYPVYTRNFDKKFKKAWNEVVK